jgi:hypothetical protein
MTHPTFYYECGNEQWVRYTDGMSEEMKRGLANALAHGMLPLKRDDHGVWLTRSDYLLPSSKYYRPDKPHLSLVDNEGKWHYYKEYPLT